MAKKTKKAAPQSRETASIKSFLDMIAPSVVKFEPDHFICGNTFRCVWALREYPTQTDEQAILRHLGEKDGITLRIYTRQVTPAEEKRIIQNAANKNRMGSSNTNDLQQTITAESNLQDVASLVASMHRNREPLLHCAVYIELTASDYNTLKLLQTDVLTELVRSKLNVDRLLLRQQQGFCCASPVGYNAFGQQFERVLPASSVANLYPFNYSGKTDAKGFYVGRDKYGSNILVDFDQRDEDKTSANILILGKAAVPDLFIKMFAGGRPITAEEYNALTAVRMENTGKVCGVFDVNFDKREFSAVHIMDGWQTWAMRDVSVASYHATRSYFASADEQWRKLLNHLNGKEITSAGHLSARNFTFGEEIIESDGKLNFYLQADFDVDAAFGTFVCTDQNDDWLNIYANYDVEQDRLCDTLELNLCKGDGSEESWSYSLNAAEQEVLLRKMEAFCQQQTGMNLHEYAQQLRDSETQAPEMQM